MARIKVILPAKFAFTTQIQVRIGDINYGGHLGNDAILSLLHEARMQFLHHLGYTEMNLGGAALIMSNVIIEFKGEAFYGDVLLASVTVSNVTNAAFDLIYKLEKQSVAKQNAVAYAQTAMVCFNYQQRKVAALPPEVVAKFTALI